MRRLRYLVVLTVVALMTGLLQGFPAVAASHGKARSDFGVRVRSNRTPLPVTGAKAAAAARKRALASRGSEFTHRLTTVRPRLVAPRPTAVKQQKASAATPPMAYGVDTPYIPGSATIGFIWKLLDSTPVLGCKVELYDAVTDALVTTRSSTAGHCREFKTIGNDYDSVYFDSAVDPILVSGEYYAKLYNYNGSGYDYLVTVHGSGPHGGLYPLYTPAFSGGLEKGWCWQCSTLGLLSTFLAYWGDPVNTATGAFSERVQDVKMAAPGLSFDLTRTYNSQNTTNGLLGVGWSFPYDAGLTIGSDKVTYRSEDGAQAVYAKNADGSFTPPPGVTSKLSTTSSGFKVVTRDYQTLAFDTAGKLTSWADRTGEGLSFGYTSGVLSSITDAAGRQVAVTVTGGKVTKVALPDGRYVGYSYTGNYLTGVRDLRGNTTSYELDPTGKLLAKVKDPKGRYTVTNEYDTSGRVHYQTDGTGYKTEYRYDYPAKGDTTAIGLRGQKTWSYRGNVLIEYIDELGNKTDYAYNQALEQIGVTDPRGNTTTMDYDDAGHMTSRVGPAPSSASEAWSYIAGTDDLDTHTDQLGTVTSYTYNGQHLPTAVTQTTVGGASRSQSYTYTSRGQVETHTSYAGRVTTNGYDTQGNLTSVTSGEGNKTGYGYDTTGRRTSVTDPRGTASAEAGDYTTSFVYDDADNVTSQTNARGKTTTSAFDEVGDLTKVTDPDNFSTVYTYDAAHRQLTMQRDGWSSPESRTYYADGLLAVVTDPTGATTKYGYDAAGRLQSKVTPRGNVSGADKTKYQWIYTADPNGNQTSVKDPDTGKTATTVFDELNRPTVVTDPLGHATTTGYDKAGNVRSVKDALGHTVRYDVDGFGRTTASYDARGNKTASTFDRDDLQLSVTSPSGHKTSYTYDKDGRTATMVEARGNETGATPADYTWTYAYDKAGNATGVTDPLGHNTTTSYDPDNNPLSRTDPLSHATNWTWDNKDRLHTVQGPDGGTTTYVYDELDNLTGRTDPLGHTTTWGYDADGRLLEQVDALGNKITHTWDPDGNPDITVTGRGNAAIAAGGSAGPYKLDEDYNARNLRTALKTTDTGVNETWIYDDAGRMASATGPGGTFTYGWDAADRLTALDRGTTSHMGWGYDADNHVTTRTYSDETVIGATYNIDGLQDSSTRAGSTATLGYDAADHLTRITYPGGSGRAETRGYDRAGRITSVTNTAGTRLSGYALTLDDAGNPTLVTGSGTHPATRAYTYDENNRLTAVCNGTTCDGATSSISYTYDQAGNRATEAHAGDYGTGTLTYHYDADNRITTTSSTTPAAAAAKASGATSAEPGLSGALGAQKTRIDPTRAGPKPGAAKTGAAKAGGPATGGGSAALPLPVGSTYTWDQDGNLTALTTPAPGGNVTTGFGYDALNRQTSQTGPNGTTSIGYDPAGDRLTLTIGTQPTRFYRYDPNYPDGVSRLAVESIGTSRQDYRYTDTGLALETTLGSITTNTPEPTSKASKTNGRASTASPADLWGAHADTRGAGASSDAGATSSRSQRTGSDGSTAPGGAAKKLSAAEVGRQNQLAQSPAAVTVTDGAWLYHDWLGSITDTIDQTTGTPEFAIDYQPFGTPTVNKLTTDALDPRLGFTGEYTDPDNAYGGGFGTSTSIYLRARTLDPATGRFLQTDPAPAETTDPYDNLYSYAGNNPAVRVDPEGRDLGDLWNLVQATRAARDYTGGAITNTVELGTLANPFLAPYEILGLNDDERFAREIGADTGTTAYKVGLFLGFPVPFAIGEEAIADSGRAGLRALLTRLQAGLRQACTEPERGSIRLQFGHESSRLTNAQATDMAARLGFRATKFRVKGQTVFTDGKRYIVQDVDTHKRQLDALWKMARKWEDLKSKQTREGTYDYNLNRIGK